MSTHQRQVENISDPYQGDVQQSEQMFRLQNHGVMARAECKHCGGSIPDSDEFSWKYAAAGGCLEGPFCSPECYWGWLA